MEDAIETIPAATHFYSNPYFVLGALGVMVVLIVLSRLCFTNTNREYVYNPHLE